MHVDVDVEVDVQPSVGCFLPGSLYVYSSRMHARTRRIVVFVRTNVTFTY